MAYQKKVTMKDIAQDCNISISTVSMILNQRKDVSFSEKTIQKVVSSAKKLGYETKESILPKKSEKSISSNVTNTIAVFCPNISNAYYSTIVQSIEQAAYLKNYKILILTTYRDKHLEKEMILDLIQMNIKGIIFTMMPNHPQFLEKVAKRIPVVVIGDKTSSLDISIIETSNYLAGILIAEHLYELGHRYISFITTTISTDISLGMRYQRLKGIQHTFQKLCINEDYDIIIKEKKIAPELERNNLFLEHEVGYDLCKRCLEDRNCSKVTAFIANNDMVAYGIMDAVLTSGFEIPKDFSVCGFDNDFASSLLPISLTTVEHFMEDKGRKAFEMLYEKIHEISSEKYIVRIEYKPKLIIRDSTNIAKK